MLLAFEGNIERHLLTAVALQTLLKQRMNGLHPIHIGIFAHFGNNRFKRF